LVDGWRRALAPLLPAVNIVLRAHPRLAPAALRPLAAAGCLVYRGRTEELVPLADVFAACISATIRWASALGIPVINYDCYRYRYGDFADAHAVVTVEDQAAFASALRDVCLDPLARKTLCDRARADRCEWGSIDGRFAARFSELLRRVSRAPVGPISVATCPLPR
jgi:hypothetical protein